MTALLPREERGFTLIELLVVILLIGVLAAIAIPIFSDKKNTADDAAAKANARELASYVESCFVHHEDYGQCATQADNEAQDLDYGSGAGQVSVTASTKTTYRIVAVSKAVTEGQNHAYTIERAAGGEMVRTCTTGPSSNDLNGCRDGSW